MNRPRRLLPLPLRRERYPIRSCHKRRRKGASRRHAVRCSQSIEFFARSTSSRGRSTVANSPRRATPDSRLRRRSAPRLVPVQTALAGLAAEYHGNKPANRPVVTPGGPRQARRGDERPEAPAAPVPGDRTVSLDERQELTNAAQTELAWIHTSSQSYERDTRSRRAASAPVRREPRVQWRQKPHLV